MTGDAEVVIDADGTVQFVYADDLAALFDGEWVKTRRASHVEPHPHFGWAVDLSPVGGPFLGANGTESRTDPARPTPFRTRQAALDAEVAWLHAEMARRRLEAR